MTGGAQNDKGALRMTGWALKNSESGPEFLYFRFAAD